MNKGVADVKTYSPKASEITHAWHVIDAADRPIGRLASEVAQLLRGKHKPGFAPHMDTGDYVVVLNAAKIAATGKKLDQKMYYRHSGYPGALKATSLRDMLAKHPERVIEHAVRGMLPKNTLGKQIRTKLKVYAGPNHPHAGQVNPGSGKQKEEGQ
jgi:large subunit ribosomal protein L13